MSTYKEKRSQAIKEVFKELYGKSQKEFNKELEKHKNSDRAKALYYAWNPEECIEYDKL